VEFVAAKVAGGSGDARKALELLSQTIQTCRETMTESELSEIPSAPFVFMKYATRVCRDQIKEILFRVDALPQTAKTVLSVLVGVTFDRPRQMTFAALKDLTNACIDQVGAGSKLTTNDFLDTLTTLQDQGLLHVADNTRFDNLTLSEMAFSPVMFEQSPDELVKAADNLGESSAIHRNLRECSSRLRTRYTATDTV